MNTPTYGLAALFCQLGLPNESGDIDRFVALHRPLSTAITLSDAPFWSAAQAAFLCDGIAADADWAQVVDHLDALLR